MPLNHSKRATVGPPPLSRKGGTASSIPLPSATSAHCRVSDPRGLRLSAVAPGEFFHPASPYSLAPDWRLMKTACRRAAD
uniref:Uncharacterized protein n=1 Tax=Oryza glaberrima TaxID=4538 RepID=A0A679BCV3_ORYGL|nr:hypothetical protein [Oryza glaberrima]